MYKKMSFGTIQELHAKEELIKKLESMKRDQTSGMIICMCIQYKVCFIFKLTSEEEDVEIFHLKEDIPESKDEQKGEFREEVQTTLEGEFLMIIFLDVTINYGMYLTFPLRESYSKWFGKISVHVSVCLTPLYLKNWTLLDFHTWRVYTPLKWQE